MIEVQEQRDSEQEIRKLTFGVLSWGPGFASRWLWNPETVTLVPELKFLMASMILMTAIPSIYKGCCDKITQICFVN